MNYIDTDDFNNIKNFKEFLNLRFGKKIKENGDEKMNEENIRDEIEQQNKKLDEMYNDIKYKLKEYYNLEYNKRDILRKNIQKQLKDLIGINESSIEIDFIELRIYVKRHKKIIYDVVKIAEIAENINYEINSIELDDRGLYLTFNEI